MAAQVTLAAEEVETAAREAGGNTVRGFLHGLNDAVSGNRLVRWLQDTFNLVPETAKDELDIHSPSRVMQELGSQTMEGYLQGISDPLWREEIAAAWHRMIQNLQADSSIDVESTVTSIIGTRGESQNDKVSGGFWHQASASVRQMWDGSQLGTLFFDLGGALGSFASALGGSLGSLGALQVVLNPLSTMFSGMMQVLEPLTNSILSPLIGILTIVGRTVGHVLAPVFELLGIVTALVGDAFVWLYNTVIRPVGNGIITIFNLLYNSVAAVINGLGKALKWLGVNMSMDYREMDAGYLAEIATADITSAASSYTGGGTSPGGSSTSVNSVSIEYHQNIQGNVIGDGGLSALGEYFVRAVEAYMGNGGSVSFIRGS